MIEFGFEIEKKGQTPALVRQIHTDKIYALEGLKDVPEGDGIFTAGPSAVYVFTADCIPLLFYDDKRVAAIHCGWKGALVEIAAKALKLFTKPTVIFGPSILDCCFEVREDFLSQFRERHGDVDDFIKRRADRTYFDLRHFVIERQLVGSKVDLTHSRCTFCSKPPLPSFRRNKIVDPVIRSWIRRN